MVLCCKLQVAIGHLQTTIGSLKTHNAMHKTNVKTSPGKLHSFKDFKNYDLQLTLTAIGEDAVNVVRTKIVNKCLSS